MSLFTSNLLLIYLIHNLLSRLYRPLQIAVIATCPNSACTFFVLQKREASQTVLWRDPWIEWLFQIKSANIWSSQHHLRQLGVKCNLFMHNIFLYLRWRVFTLHLFEGAGYFVESSVIETTLHCHESHIVISILVQFLIREIPIVFGIPLSNMQFFGLVLDSCVCIWVVSKLLTSRASYNRRQFLHFTSCLLIILDRATESFVKILIV